MNQPAPHPLGSNREGMPGGGSHHKLSYSFYHVAVYGITYGSDHRDTWPTPPLSGLIIVHAPFATHKTSPPSTTICRHRRRFTTCPGPSNREPPPRSRQVLINVRNNHKLLARVKAFDRHCNM